MSSFADYSERLQGVLKRADWAPVTGCPTLCEW